MVKKLRVLIIAEAANPEFVSVPLVGWSLTSALREYVDVHLATQTRNCNAIKRAGWVEGEDFTAIDSEAVAGPVTRFASWVLGGSNKGWTFKTALYSLLSQPYFERLVWKRFAQDIERGEFDIVHRITPLSPTAISPIAEKCKKAQVPFIVGPLNGGLAWPKGFDKARRQELEWLSYIRFVHKYRPGFRCFQDACAALVCASRHTLQEVPEKYHDKTFYLPENGIDPSRFKGESNLENRKLPLKACFIGRMVPYKGADMLLEACAPLLRDGKLHLELIGDGPMLSSLKELVKVLDVQDKVVFHGWKKHEDIPSLIKECDLLTFPSVREFGGGVVLEAMAMGVIPVIVDYGGPGELVNSQTGFKVPIGSREKIIEGFEKTLREIVANPAPLKEMRMQAIQEVEQKFLWSKKAVQILRVYNWVLDPGQAKPELFDHQKK